MARKTYRIVMEFTYSNGTTGGRLDGTVNAKSRIKEQIDANRAWLAGKGHTETSLLVVDSTGHVLHDSKPRQESEHERGLARADAARTATKHWDWPGLK